MILVEMLRKTHCTQVCIRPTFVCKRSLFAFVCKHVFSIQNIFQSIFEPYLMELVPLHLPMESAKP